MDEIHNINGLPKLGFVELRIFAKAVAVFCNSVQNCKIRQDSCPAFGGITKSALADFITGVNHGY
jgi:hypothetical protein